MEESKYIMLGFLWIVACILLGLYITGRGLNGRKHYRIGFSALIISYLLGVGVLLVAIVVV